MRIIAIDPGTYQSGVVVVDDEEILYSAIDDNGALVGNIAAFANEEAFLVIEMVASYGKAVGREIFETCVWIGRFWEAINNIPAERKYLVYRKKVLSAICGTTKAKDSDVRRAIIARYGEGSIAKGGALQGIKRDIWQALALAIAFKEGYGNVGSIGN